MDEGTSSEAKKGSKQSLPEGAVAILKAWMLSPEHFAHPYPTPQEQIVLMHKTGIDKKQLKNWFTNARRRLWKPMLKQRLDQGKLAATTTAAALVQQLQPINMGVHVPTGQIEGESSQRNIMAQADGNAHALHLHVRDPYDNPSIGNNQTPNLDSHAVLMELFARDQDLVRQAMEDAKLKAQAAKEGLQ